jgi:hypothetical protein
MKNTIAIGWSLKSLSIIKVEWGENRGQYKGKIVFESGTAEEMAMNIPPERCAEYMKILAEDIVASANDLGARVANSIMPPALPESSQNNEATNNQ